MSLMIVLFFPVFMEFKRTEFKRTVPKIVHMHIYAV